MDRTDRTGQDKGGAAPGCLGEGFRGLRWEVPPLTLQWPYSPPPPVLSDGVGGLPGSQKCNPGGVASPLSETGGRVGGG